MGGGGGGRRQTLRETETEQGSERERLYLYDGVNSQRGDLQLHTVGEVGAAVVDDH